MSPNKAPSEGTKVDLGRNAPIKNEAAGPVGSESLAAESYREGGEFSHNVGAQPENLTSGSERTSGGTKLDSAPDAESRERANDTSSYNAASYDVAAGSGNNRTAGTAPTYVSNQYIRDTKGPHGKNVQEGFDDAGTKDGLKAALAAEPGSEQDPSRLAEYQLDLKNNAKSAQAVPRDSTVTNETKYDALNETSA